MQDLQDLGFPFLTPRIVSGLTGLSSRELRRLDRNGIPAARRGARTQPADRRLYSWRDVELLQRATHLLESTRCSMDEVKRLLKRPRTASPDHDWVIARPKPRVRRRTGGGGGGRRVPARVMR